MIWKMHGCTCPIYQGKRIVQKIFTATLMMKYNEMLHMNTSKISLLSIYACY